MKIIWTTTCVNKKEIPLFFFPSFSFPTSGKTVKNHLKKLVQRRKICSRCWAKPDYHSRREKVQVHTWLLSAGKAGWRPKISPLERRSFLETLNQMKSSKEYIQKNTEKQQERLTTGPHWNYDWVWRKKKKKIKQPDFIFLFLSFFFFVTTFEFTVSVCAFVEVWLWVSFCLFSYDCL